MAIALLRASRVPRPNQLDLNERFTAFGRDMEPIRALAMFDIGSTKRQAAQTIPRKQVNPVAGSTSDRRAGNGSLIASGADCLYALTIQRGSLFAERKAHHACGSSSSGSMRPLSF